MNNTPAMKVVLLNGATLEVADRQPDQVVALVRTHADDDHETVHPSQVAYDVTDPESVAQTCEIRALIGVIRHSVVRSCAARAQECLTNRLFQI